MSDRALLPVESGRRRSSRHRESPRDFIQRLQVEFPDDSQSRRASDTLRVFGMLSCSMTPRPSFSSLDR
jgi:hypothetical protein